ncbi:MAG: GNAT family N-acetyltransferase [Mycobacteriales bacterium]
MRAELMSDARQYSTRIAALLRADPVAHHPLATALDRALRIPVVGQNPDDRWALAVDGGAVTGVALHRPPDPAVVGLMSDTTAGALAGLLSEVRPDLPGVYGPQPTVDAFATMWQERGYARPVLERSDGVWTLDSADALSDTAYATGELRPAGEHDLPLLRDWGLDGVDGTTLLWEAGGQPVAAATVSRPLHGVVAIGTVYTLPELRRHGYGLAVAAAASRHALESGAERCIYHGTLDRPDSLFEELGYRRTGEVRRYAFERSNTEHPTGLSMTGTTTAAPRHHV